MHKSDSTLSGLTFHIFYIKVNSDMTEPVVGLEVTAAEQFSSALSDLHSLGKGAYEDYEALREKYGLRVAEDVGMRPEPNPTAEALASLLGTIPGVEITSEIRETMAKPASLIGSHRAVSAYMYKEGGSYIGVDVSLAAVETGETSVELERVINDKRLSVRLQFTSGGEFLKGRVTTADVDQHPGFRGVIERGSLTLDSQGKITSSSGEMQSDIKEVERIDVPILLGSITTTKGLDQEIDTKGILTKAAS